VKNRVLYFIITFLILLVATINLVGCGGSSSFTPPSFSRFVVCLDPGHPSETSAGVSINGFDEVKVNWLVAKELELLLKNQGVTVIMTKNTVEQMVSNKDRALLANRYDSNLLMRLHCDSADGNVRGITFYYPDQQGTKDGKTGPSDDIIQKSKQASLIIHAKTIEKLEGALIDRAIKGESKTLIGEQQGVLTASIYSEVPVITVEMVFLDNKDDAEFIGSESGRQKMAEALNEGIIAYLSTL
jgi:N-acetylmuramoyl-L-alanine amidase